MPDIEGIYVGGQMRHHGEAQTSNFMIHMVISLHRQSLPIRDKFKKTGLF